MPNNIVLALRAAVVTLVLTGIAYPLLVTAVAQVAFSHQANGSLVRDEKGGVIGSELLAQPFANAAYVQPRPSAANYCLKPESGIPASSGSNLAPTSKALRDRVTADVARLRSENPAAPAPVPAEIVTTSGSGLDPHLSPDSVEWQVPRIAAARGVTQDRVRAVIADFIQGRDLGILGEARVNVLAVNVALDRRFGRASATATIPPK